MSIGTQLINELLKISFQELKVELLNLNIFDWNISAIKCYKKSGIKLTKELHRS